MFTPNVNLQKIKINKKSEKVKLNQKIFAEIQQSKQYTPYMSSKMQISTKIMVLKTSRNLEKIIGIYLAFFFYVK